MECILGVLYQLRSTFGAFIDLNILFEFISLLYMIMWENNKSVYLLYVLSQTTDIQVNLKLKKIKQERMIMIGIKTLMVISFVQRIFGLMVILRYIQDFTMVYFYDDE